MGSHLKKISILPVSFKSSFSSRVGLKKARLGDEQLRAILSCSLGRTRLRQIDLSGVNLSAVPGDLLALAISRLCEADLACTWLTRTQLTALVAQVCRFTRLEHLRLQAATAALLSKYNSQLSYEICFMCNRPPKLHHSQATFSVQ